MFVTTAIIIIISLVIYTYITNRRFKSLKVLPNPNEHFLWGSVFYLSRRTDELFKQLRTFATDYPEGYQLTSTFQSFMTVLALEDLEVLLSSIKHIEKSRHYELLHPWLNQGLITNGGAKWQQRRKILTPAFHFNILRRFLVIFGEHSQQLVKQLKDESKKPKTNLSHYMSTHTLNVICEAAMGISLDLTNESHVQYREAIYKLAPILVDRSLKPWLYNQFVFDLTANGRKQKELLKILNNFVKDIITERENNFDEKILSNLDEDDVTFSKKRLAMLDLLIHAKKTEASIDDEGIHEEVSTFMFAGHDTTAAALSFALMLLSHEPEVQENLYEEQISIFGNSDQAASYEDIQNMKYLDMCLKECLRICPAVPYISRQTTEEVPLKNLVLPADCMVLFQIYDIHRNPKYFPDPEKFDPNRFLPENTVNRHPYVYIPFSAGPRNCIGQRFALFEIKCTLSSIIRNFILEPVGRKEDVIKIVDIVLRTRDPLYVKFKERIRA